MSDTRYTYDHTLEIGPSTSLDIDAGSPLAWGPEELRITHTAGDTRVTHAASGAPDLWSVPAVSFYEGLSVYPDSAKDQAWRQNAGYGYRGILADAPAPGGTTGILLQGIDDIGHGLQGVMAARLGGVLVH